MVIWIGGKDLPANQAMVGFARRYRGQARLFAFSVSLFRTVEAQADFAAGLIWAVALETAVGENGPDVAVELKLFGSGGK